LLSAWYYFGMSVSRSIRDFADRVVKLQVGQQILGKKGIVAKRTEHCGLEFTSPKSRAVINTNLNEPQNIRSIISQLSKAQ